MKEKTISKMLCSIEKTLDYYESLTCDEKIAFMFVLLDNEYDWREDIKEDEKLNKSLLFFLRNKKFKPVLKLGLRIINDYERGMTVDYNRINKLTEKIRKKIYE